MVARITGRYDAALSHAERGARLAPACLARALLHAWALLPALARLHRADEADQALRTALAELEADPSGTAPSRFGFDEPELALHQAEADLALGRHQQARTRAEASCAACPDGTGGWAAGRPPPSSSPRPKRPARHRTPSSVPCTSWTTSPPPSTTTDTPSEIKTPKNQVGRVGRRSRTCGLTDSAASPAAWFSVTRVNPQGPYRTANRRHRGQAQRLPVEHRDPPHQAHF